MSESLSDPTVPPNLSIQNSEGNYLELEFKEDAVNTRLTFPESTVGYLNNDGSGNLSWDVIPSVSYPYRLINVQTLGVLGDGSNETTIINNVIKTYPYLYWPAGTYVTTTRASVSAFSTDSVEWFLDSGAVLSVSIWFSAQNTSNNNTSAVIRGNGGILRKPVNTNSNEYSVRMVNYKTMIMDGVVFSGESYSLLSVSVPYRSVAAMSVDLAQTTNLIVSMCKFIEEARSLYIRSFSADPKNVINVDNNYFYRELNDGYQLTMINFNPEGSDVNFYTLNNVSFRNNVVDLRNAITSSVNMCVEARATENFYAIGNTLTGGAYGFSVGVSSAMAAIGKFMCEHNKFDQQTNASIECYMTISVIRNNRFYSSLHDIVPSNANYQYGNAVFLGNGYDTNNTIFIFSDNYVTDIPHPIWFYEKISKADIRDNIFKNVQYADLTAGALFINESNVTYLNVHRNQFDSTAQYTAKTMADIKLGKITLDTIESPTVSVTPGSWTPGSNIAVSADTTFVQYGETGIKTTCSGGSNATKYATQTITLTSAINQDNLVYATFSCIFRKSSTDYSNIVALTITPLSASDVVLSSTVTQAAVGGSTFKFVTVSTLCPKTTEKIQVQIGASFNGVTIFSQLTLNIGTDTSITYNRGHYFSSTRFSTMINSIETSSMNSSGYQINLPIKQAGNNAAILGLPNASITTSLLDSSSISLWLNETNSTVNYVTKSSAGTVLTGSFSNIYNTTTSASTSINLTSTNNLVECTGSSNVTVTLPQLSLNNGQRYYVIHNSASAINVTIAVQVGESLNGVVDGTYVISTRYNKVSIVGGVSGWFLFP